MKKNITINLTAREIEALQISISAAVLDLEKEVDNLKEHNKSGINTNSIRLKADRINELNTLWEKLYDAEKLMQ